MTHDEALQDVAIRRQQLEQHLLASPEYLVRADQDLKRQVVMLYLAIALLLFFQLLFTLNEMGRIPGGEILLIALVSILAIANCFLLIQTKKCLRRLNSAWLNTDAKSALETLRTQHEEILQRAASDANGN